MQVAPDIMWLKQWGGHAKEQCAPVRLSLCTAGGVEGTILIASSLGREQLG